MRLWQWAFFLPLVFLVLLQCRAAAVSTFNTGLCLLAAALLWAVVVSVFHDSIIRPLQILANIVSALREDDFTFRARGAMRGDALGDLALELNALAGVLQAQRNAAMDALTLADRVIASMHSPVLAFDADGRLRLMNAAAERAFSLKRNDALGRTAQELHLQDLLSLEDQAVLQPQLNSPQGTGATPRWSVRRNSFRLHGVPHTLLLLNDVDAALREEERLAWQRLIRVLSHEINNSLTPIKSVAGMLRARSFQLSPELHTSQDSSDLKRGLGMIEERADSLHRFLQAYQQLSRLPAPVPQRFSVNACVQGTVLLEQRVPIFIKPSPVAEIDADPDQFQQLLINLLKNAADAATSPEANTASPRIEVGWATEEGNLVLQIVDNGIGLANPANLFVPFYTTKPDGSGIGLTLCRQIVVEHRGSITLANRSDRQGCIVEVRFPLR